MIDRRAFLLTSGDRRCRDAPRMRSAKPEPSTQLGALFDLIMTQNRRLGPRTGKGEAGNRFDIKAFHDAVLAHGRVPLEILQQIGDRWVTTLS